MSRISIFAALAAAMLVLSGCSTCYPDHRLVDFSIHENKITPELLEKAAAEIRGIMAAHGLRSMEELEGRPPDPSFVHYLGSYPGNGRRFFYYPREGALSLDITNSPDGAEIRAEWRQALVRMVGPDGFDEREHPYCRSGFTDTGTRSTC